MSRLTSLVKHLDRHVQREEDGIFRAPRSAGEFLDEVDKLEDEHRGLEATIAGLDIDSRTSGRGSCDCSIRTRRALRSDPTPSPV
jgi:Hemerythrin HHE cation binding domain